MKVYIDVVQVSVLKTDGTDRIIVEYNGDPLYPGIDPKSLPSLSIDVAKGLGISYAEKMFGRVDRVIDASSRIQYEAKQKGSEDEKVYHSM